jgi:hypothetical protein
LPILDPDQQTVNRDVSLVPNCEDVLINEEGTPTKHYS